MGGYTEDKGKSAVNRVAIEAELYEIEAMARRRGAER